MQSAQSAIEEVNQASTDPKEAYDNESPPRSTRYNNYWFALYLADPITYNDALKCNEWWDAMREEMLSIQKNDTRGLVERQEGKKIISLKWIFKTKYKANGEIQKLNVRIIVMGYTQQLGVDVEDVFYPWLTWKCWGFYLL